MNYGMRMLQTKKKGESFMESFFSKILKSQFLHNIQHELHEKFGIVHPTIQIEQEDTENNCHLDRSDCI